MVWLFLDSYQTGRTASEFGVNPSRRKLLTAAGGGSARRCGGGIEETDWQS